MNYVHILEAVVGGLLSIVMGFITHWVRRLEMEQDKQNVRISDMAKDNAATAAGLASLTAEMHGIRELLEQHLEREEGIMWKRIEAMELANQTSHTEMNKAINQLTGDVRELVGVMAQLTGAKKSA